MGLLVSVPNPPIRPVLRAYYLDSEQLELDFSEAATQEELTAVIVACMEKVAEAPDFDPLAFQGALLAAMTQGVGE